MRCTSDVEEHVRTSLVAWVEPCLLLSRLSSFLLLSLPVSLSLLQAQKMSRMDIDGETKDDTQPNPKVPKSHDLLLFEKRLSTTQKEFPFTALWKNEFGSELLYLCYNARGRRDVVFQNDNGGVQVLEISAPTPVGLFCRAGSMAGACEELTSMVGFRKVLQCESVLTFCHCCHISGRVHLDRSPLYNGEYLLLCGICGLDAQLHTSDGRFVWEPLRIGAVDHKCGVSGRL